MRAMELKKFINEMVSIVSNDGITFCGVVADYFHPDENESGEESIVIDTPDGKVIEFYGKDIKSIKVKD